MTNKKTKSWSYKDDKELIKYYNEGKSTKWIANYFQATEGSIYARAAAFRQAGLIKEGGGQHANFDQETIKEMEDAVRRFGKMSLIPDEWIDGWAQQNKGANILSVINFLKKVYEKERK